LNDDALLASRFLAVSTPRSYGLVGCGPVAREVLDAHLGFFPAPKDIRRSDETTVERACACDIVLITEPATIRPEWVRRGTHINDLVGALDLSGFAHARVVQGRAALDEIAAGYVDGRELDEITIYVR